MEGVGSAAKETTGRDISIVFCRATILAFLSYLFSKNVPSYLNFLRISFAVESFIPSFNETIEIGILL